MKSSDWIRQTFLEQFEGEGHLRRASASLVPATLDPSVLLTTAGMHPLKPYFLGQEVPPAGTMTSCQKCFRTTDIENVGTTARHLTFFEMLGNFSIGEYFKEGAIEHAWRLVTGPFGFDPERVWITVFAGDEALGLGADDEAIDAWLSVGVARERIVALGRADNFWQAGPTGPCGPCSELYLDRGPDFGPDSERPGDDGERFLEFWNLVFMEFEQHETGPLTPLPSRNIDTGMGLNRMAAILQGVGSIFETDQFAPLMELGRRRAANDPQERSLRILADHSRAMCFLIADGVVPSNEERGYILRRLMRRAILHGRRLGMEPGFLNAYAVEVEQLMGAAYPELVEQRDAIRAWLDSEETGFGRTLEAGTQMLEELIAAAGSQGAEGISAEDAFQLHDTHGFPIDLTLELAAEQGMGVDESGFELLMDAQRERARGGSATAAGSGDQAGRDLASLSRTVAEEGAATEFTGYDSLQEEATVVSVADATDGRILVKLDRSPFYAAGGGQVSDTGSLLIGDRTDLNVQQVLRVGDGQVLVVDSSNAIEPGQKVIASVDRSARLATQANHTATHLLHAALRERLGSHVRQAGSYVGPDKLRFDFTHGEQLTRADLDAVEDEVNARIAANDHVGWRSMPIDEAKALGAMALFGEKYGEVVRMVEVGDGSHSRELCGGTHVTSTAEIGLVKIVNEGSSAANVRRIEAVSGPRAVELLRSRDSILGEIATSLRTTPENAASALARREERIRELEGKLRSAAGAEAGGLVSNAVDVAGVKVLCERVEGVDAKGLPDLVDRLRSELGEDSVVVLAAPGEGRVDLIVGVGKSVVERGVRAGDVVAAAAAAVGGGGGGRDTLARAGGKDPSKISEALSIAMTTVESALG